MITIARLALKLLIAWARARPPNTIGAILTKAIK